MGASGRSSVDDDGTLLLRPPPCSSQPTCWELPSTEDSKTPNPRPTKTMRTEESSDPPPQPLYEVVLGVDLHVPPPLVDEDESSEEKPKGEGGAEPEETIEYDTDDILEDMEGWGYLPSGAEPVVKKKEEEESDSETEEEKAFWAEVVPIAASSPAKKECNVCYDDHYTCDCTYFDRIPYGMDVPNKDYVVACECGSICKNGGDCPNAYCLRKEARFVVPKREQIARFVR